MKPRKTSLHERPAKSQSRTPDPEKYRALYLPDLKFSAVMQYNEAKGLWMRHHDVGTTYHYRVVDNDGWSTYWQLEKEARAYYNSLPILSNRIFMKMQSPMVW